MPCQDRSPDRCDRVVAEQVNRVACARVPLAPAFPASVGWAKARSAVPTQNRQPFLMTWASLRSAHPTLLSAKTGHQMSREIGGPQRRPELATPAALWSLRLFSQQSSFSG